MPRTTITKPVIRAVAKNGVGAYILQCRKIAFNYCERWVSNKGLCEYIKKDLVNFARENPQIEIQVTPRPSHHPVITGYYLNGRDKVICVRNLTPRQISDKVRLLRESNGGKMKLLAKKKVISSTESVRGIWSPFRTTKHEI